MKNSPIEEIAAERERQITKEHWSKDHDDQHTNEALSLAAACYAAPIPILREVRGRGSILYVDPWPWVITNRGDEINAITEWAKEGKDRRRQLVIAGALIVAEIERLDRAAG